MPVPRQGHPYMANATEAARRRMMDAVGIADVEELFEQIPSSHRARAAMQWDEPLMAESQLYQHMLGLLNRNGDCESNLSFLGAGAYRHYVPAIVDTVISRSEFLTPVWGTPSSDHGRTQAWFEFTSQLGELLELEFVGLPVYSYGAAAGHALRMAGRMTGRSQVLVARNVDPERLKVMRTYAGYPELDGYLEITLVDFDPNTGRINLDDLRSKLSDRVAAVYFEMPNYFGGLDPEAATVTSLARQHGAESIVGVDPISLGVVAPPSRYGADLVVGTIQTLGVHLNAGGGVAGFIASRDEERYARQFPTLQVSLADTVVPGERAFGLTLFDQSSYHSREGGNDWTGNGTYLWAIAAAVYMSAMGPQGMVEVGESVLRRTAYAAEALAAVPGVRVHFADGAFREFVVNFDAVKQPLEAIDTALRERGIFAGRSLQADFPELGKSSLYCFTELHSQADIDRLASTLKEVVGA